MVFVVASEKKWHYPLFEKLRLQFPGFRWYLINTKESLTIDYLNEIGPVKIFFPHWSYIIPVEVYMKYECIVFHMTDLPYGRGGSPLQNLIVRGHKKTKVSALRVEDGIDTGPIYLKKDLNLDGSAQEIFLRCSDIIGEMIAEIITKDPKPEEQQGEVVLFKRRKPEQSSLEDVSDIDALYDFIRMLDAEGYPNAFFQTENFRFEFYNASLTNDKTLTASVRILKK
jgi:methionyl-tRNA formyltransferase